VTCVGMLGWLQCIFAWLQCTSCVAVMHACVPNV
jgi:hypothetical protein